MRRPTFADRLRTLRLARRQLRRDRNRIFGSSGVAPRTRSRARSLRAAVNPQLFEESAEGITGPQLIPSHWHDLDGSRWRCRRLRAPVDFQFHRNPDEILAFVYELRRQVFVNDRFRRRGNKQKPSLYIDLDYIQHIDLEGALILTAEIDRIRLVYNIKPYMDDANWNRGVRAVLYGMGLYTVIEAGRYKGAPAIDDIAAILEDQGLTIVPFVSCHEADPSKANQLRSDLWEHCATSDEAQFAVYDALVEAFSNAVQHAYRADVPGDGLPSVRRWWAGGLVDKKSGYLLLVVYDQGVGIPKTLPRRPFWHQIVGHMPERDDASVIAGALEYGRSGTSATVALAPDAEGRGNGLWRMCEMTSAFPYADVRFTSLRGDVLYTHGKSPERATLATRFCGTMIRWRAQIGPVEGQVG